MQWLFTSGIAIAGLLAVAPLDAAAQSTAPATQPAPGVLDAAELPPENPLVSARVRTEFMNWQRGRIDRSTYSPTASGTYIDSFINVVAPQLQAVGPLQSVTYRSASLLLGDLVYRYDISGANGNVSVLYSLDERGRTDGITFTPEIFRAMPAP